MVFRELYKNLTFLFIFFLYYEKLQNYYEYFIILVNFKIVKKETRVSYKFSIESLLSNSTKNVPLLVYALVYN